MEKEDGDEAPEVEAAVEEDIVVKLRRGVEVTGVAAEGNPGKTPVLLTNSHWLAMMSLTHIISQQTHHLRSALLSCPTSKPAYSWSNSIGDD